MFGRDNTLVPTEICVSIFSFFSKKEKLQNRLVSRHWRELLEAKPLWQKSGADSCENFLSIIQEAVNEAVGVGGRVYHLNN